MAKLPTENRLGTLAREGQLDLQRFTAMKGQLPVVGCRIPHLLNDRLMELSQATGDSPSKILRDALSSYLGSTAQRQCDRLRNG